MGLGCSGQIGHLGDNPFAVIGVDIGLLLRLHGVALQVTRHDADAPRDLYGEPQDSPTPFPATVLLAKQELDEVATIAGGKRNETLTLVGQPGTLQVNDIIVYLGRNYDVRHVGGSIAQSAIVAEMYTAVSQVDV